MSHQQCDHLPLYTPSPDHHLSHRKGSEFDDEKPYAQQEP